MMMTPKNFSEPLGACLPARQAQSLRRKFISPPRASAREIQGIPGKGPTRSHTWNPWPGFPIPGIPGFLRPLSALIAPGKQIFSCETEFAEIALKGRILLPDAALGRCEADRNNRRAGPPSEADSNRLQSRPAVARQPFVFLPSPRIWKKAGIVLDNGNVRRPSVRGRQWDSALFARRSAAEERNFLLARLCHD